MNRHTKTNLTMADGCGKACWGKAMFSNCVLMVAKKWVMNQGIDALARQMFKNVLALITESPEHKQMMHV